MKERIVGYLVRHGETMANADGRYRSWSDPPLNDKGLAQARAAAKFLSKEPIKHIISSPLLRAFITADIIAGPHKLQVFQHRGLFPWRLGIFTGLPKDENGNALRLFVDNPEVCMPEGESLNDFEERQFAFWQASLEMAHDGGLTVYIAHTSNVTALVNFTEGAHDIEPEFGDSIKPGGVAAIYFNGKQHRVEPIFGNVEEAVFGGS
jgi:broad specificity phosphatase PhoE